MAVVRHRGGPGTTAGGGGGGRPASSAAAGDSAKSSSSSSSSSRTALPSAALVAWLLLLLLGALAGPLYLAWAQLEETRETARGAARESAELGRRVRDVETRLESQTAQLGPLLAAASATRRDLDGALARNDAEARTARDSLASLERRLAVDMESSDQALRHEVAAVAAALARAGVELRGELAAALATENARDDDLRSRLEELSTGLESLRLSERASSERLERLDSLAAAALEERRALAERAASLAAAAASPLAADAERCRASADESLAATRAASLELEGLRRELEALELRWDGAHAQAEAVAERARRDLDGLQRLAGNHEGRLGEVAEAVTALEGRLSDGERPRQGDDGDEAERERLRRLEERLAEMEEARARDDGLALEVEELRAAVGDAEERRREAAESDAAGDGRLRELVTDAVAAAEGRLAAELEAMVAAQRSERSPGGVEEEEVGSIGSLREELQRVEEQLAVVQRAVLDGSGQAQ